MTTDYRPRYGGGISETNCRAGIYDDRRYHQCSRKGLIERNGKLYCKQHDPVAVEEKHKEREEKHKERQDAWARKWKEQREARAKEEAQKRLERDALDALRQISAGHNDPRSLAQQVLSQEPQG